MRILFLLFTIVIFSSSAQKPLALEMPSTEIETGEYHFSNFIDSTASSSLGSIYISGSEKKAFRSKMDLSEALSIYFKAFVKTELTSLPITVSIKNVLYSESIDKNYLIDGKLDIQIDFYVNFDGKQSILYTTRGGAKYNRSISWAYEENLANLLSSVLKTSLMQFDAYVEANKSKLECFNLGSLVIVEDFRNDDPIDTLFYQKGPISWLDFKGASKGFSKYSAAIFPNFSLQSSFYIEDRMLKARIKPSVFMIPSMSWVRQGSQNSYSLAHEQLHFDIAYFVAKSLVEKLKKVEANTIADLQSFVQYEYLKSYREMNQLEDQYDFETAHGLNETKQAEWAKRFSSPEQ